MESEPDVHNKKCPGIVTLVFFDEASNVQNAGEILKAFNPCITIGHGADDDTGTGLKNTVMKFWKKV